MFKNYFKTAFRHLKRHKSYLLINVLGLALALALCIVAYVNWKFDRDFDKFHPQADKIFRVATVKSGSLQKYGVCPAPVAEAAKTDIAGVEDAIVMDSWNVTVNKGENTFAESILFTEPSFLKWFNFPLLSGQADLENPNTLLISNQMASKYFGEEDPIGQTLTLFAGEDRRKDLVVSGVLEDHPRNSSIYPNFITNLSNQVRGDGSLVRSTEWEQWREVVFLVLEKPENAPDVLAELNRYIPIHRQVMPDFASQEFFLEPLPTMAHHARELRRDALRSSLPPSAVWSNIVMAILLLLVASLNFTNTTISLAGRRLKEIGVRKVLGGTQKQLVQQLLSESFLVCILGLGLGLVFADYVLKVYNSMYTFLDLKMSLSENPALAGFLVGTVFLTTLLAGAYPAFYISSFNPKKIFRGSVKFGGSNLVSRILLGLQVAISLVALVAGLSFARNAHFQQTTDLGFERDGIQAVVTDDEATFRVLQNEALKNPKILASAGVRSHVGDSCPRVECSINAQKAEVEYMTVGERYLELMDMEIIQGRGFNYEMETDYQNAIVVNEKFVDDFLQNVDPIGQAVVFFDTLQCSIIGVIGNFMQDSFFDPLRPLVLNLKKADQYQYLAIKTGATDMMAVRSDLEQIWKSNFPLQPFEHFYQDDFLAMDMLVTNNIKWFMLIVAIITFLLTVTGLFALISLNIMKRMKEIAVRRVLGATMQNISFLLNKNYLWIITSGIVIGIASGAWFALLLLDSIYSIHAGVSSVIMTAAGLCAILAVMTTIGIKIWQIRQMNVADVLKRE